MESTFFEKLGLYCNRVNRPIGGIRLRNIFTHFIWKPLNISKKFRNLLKI